VRFPDPNNTIIFDRTKEELECFLLFCIVAAGKKASVQVRLLDSFLSKGKVGASPFDKIRTMDSEGALFEKLMESRLGQYNRLAHCFRALISSGVDLFNCTVDDLESIHGIGPKTSRFFLTCTRPNVRFGVIDTHLLKFMRDYLGESNIPTSTPGSKKEYNRLEKIYLDYADEIGVDSAELDLAIWKIYANKDRTDFERLTKVPQMAHN
jgi:thermostable 8-oxoguanine DNA glycosylase